MKRTLLFYVLVFGIISCDNSKVENQNESLKEEAPAFNDSVPKVTGIGGVFFKAKNPKEIKEWYGNNLGLNVDDFGIPFEFRNAHRPGQPNYLNWDAFTDSTSYFDPSEKEFMINYRVQNLEGLVDTLRNNGVNIVDEIVSYEYGKFIHIMDPEGNKIELWEPVDSVLTKMGRVTNK